MNIRKGIYKDVSIRWNTIELPLKAGTPIGFGGTVANSAAAIGLVPQTIDVKPVTPYVSVLIGGDVDLAEVEASYGSTLSQDAISAMSGITFYDKNGRPVPAGASGGGVPTITESDIGKVLTAGEDGAEWAAASGGDVLIVKIAEDENTGEYAADKNWNDISAALAAGQHVMGLVKVTSDTVLTSTSLVCDNTGATFTCLLTVVEDSALIISHEKFTLAKGSYYNVTATESEFVVDAGGAFGG